MPIGDDLVVTPTEWGAAYSFRDGAASIRIGRDAEVSIGARRLRAQRYGAVQDLVFLDELDQPVAWFAGGAGLAGARVVVAPDREYDLRVARNPLKPAWRLVEDAGALARFTPRKGSLSQGLTITRERVPDHRPDEEIMLPVVAYGLLVRTTLIEFQPDGGGG